MDSHGHAGQWTTQNRTGGGGGGTCLLVDNTNGLAKIAN